MSAGLGSARAAGKTLETPGRGAFVMSRSTVLVSRRVWLAAGAAGALSERWIPNTADAVQPGFVFGKTGRVILPRGPAGSFDSTHAKYPCVLKHGDRWMMWYSGRGDDAFTGSIGLATSRNAVSYTHLTLPTKA